RPGAPVGAEPGRGQGAASGRADRRHARVGNGRAAGRAARVVEPSGVADALRGGWLRARGARAPQREGARLPRGTAARDGGRMTVTDLRPVTIGGSTIGAVCGR